MVFLQFMPAHVVQDGNLGAWIDNDCDKESKKDKKMYMNLTFTCEIVWPHVMEAEKLLPEIVLYLMGNTDLVK